MMSNTTSHILLLIQCVLESCIWILFSEKKILVFVTGYYFQKKRFLFLVIVIGNYFQKKDFCSCVCNWILFSKTKKIFDSCD